MAAGSSVVFIRESTEPPVMLAAYRVLIAGVALLPLYLRDSHRAGHTPIAAVLSRSWLPAGVLAVHFIFWVLGARMTTAANASLIVNLMPVVMPLFMLAMFRERIQAREMLATAIALVGMLILGAADYKLSSAHFNGDLMCLVAMLLFAWYLAIARRHRGLATVWLYVVPVYLLAGIFTLAVALFFSSPFHTYTAYNLSMIVLLAMVSTVIGHTALNYAMQRLRGQTVTVVNLGQFIVGGVLGYWIYTEVPSITFYSASSLLVFAMWLVISNQAKEVTGKPVASIEQKQRE